MTTTLLLAPNALRTFAPVCRWCGAKIPLLDCRYTATPGCRRATEPLHRLWLDALAAERRGAARFERLGWAGLGLISAAAVVLSTGQGAELGRWLSTFTTGVGRWLGAG